ncbi:hypothetical protein BJ138DRAFT_811775 [Hygrophoropsis aurantiaca]|uniref:Uncharacterized protein n=1 Tax=Hygrophoropsis aurantiaca TaxID=72124 RepID=A0ACB7ZV83_9AGAM|nr:hypothetical protein BJ138DRAFT_811775 [Hygrophoropsis aurantiaca]
MRIHLQDSGTLAGIEVNPAGILAEAVADFVPDYGIRQFFRKNRSAEGAAETDGISPAYRLALNLMKSTKDNMAVYDLRAPSVLSAIQHAASDENINVAIMMNKMKALDDSTPSNIGNRQVQDMFRCHEILMQLKDNEIRRFKEHVANDQAAAKRASDEATVRHAHIVQDLTSKLHSADVAITSGQCQNSVQHTKILGQQVELQELQDALTNAHYLQETNSAQYTTSLGSRDAEIARLCAMQPQFDSELATRNDKIASQAGEIAKVIDIVQDQKAIIFALETSLAIKDRLLARSEKSLKTEMRITDELYGKNLELGDRLDRMGCDKATISWLEKLLSTKEKEVALLRDSLDDERSEHELLKIHRQADLTQHANDLSARDADIAKLTSALVNAQFESIKPNAGDALPIVKGKEADAGCLSTVKLTGVLPGPGFSDAQVTSDSMKLRAPDGALGPAPLTLNSDTRRLSIDSFASDTTLCNLDTEDRAAETWHAAFTESAFESNSSSSVPDNDKGLSVMSSDGDVATAVAPTSKTKVAVSKGKSLVSKGKVLVAKGKVLVSKGKVSFSEGKVPVSNGKVPASNGKAPVSKGKTSASKGKVVSKDSVAVSKGKVVVSKGEVPASKSKVPDTQKSTFRKVLRPAISNWRF